MRDSWLNCSAPIRQICLTTTLEWFLNLSVFLIKSLSAFFWEWVFESIGSVVSCQNIDRGVEGGEWWLSSYLRETSVIRNEVNHLFLHVFTIIFHLVCSFSQACCDNHMLTYFCGILVIIKCQAPVIREIICCELFWYNNFCWCSKWECTTYCYSCCSCSCVLDEVTASSYWCYFLLNKFWEKKVKRHVSIIAFGRRILSWQNTKWFCEGIVCSSLVEYLIICDSYIETGYEHLFFYWLTGTEIFVLGEKADTATAPTESKKSWALTIIAIDNEELCTWKGIPSLLEKGRGHGHTSSSSIVDRISLTYWNSTLLSV